MALSAVDLQKRHELEGAPDPFPSLAEPAPAKKTFSSLPELDTDSQSAFPSLASATPVASAAPSNTAWGASSGPRIKSLASRQPVYADSLTLSAIDLSTAGKDGKPASLGDVIKQVTTKYKVKVEGSANQKTRQHTFHIKAETEKELDKAKRSLLALLSPVITLVINAPASTIPSIIGVKGATLKQIRDQTGVRVDIPRKDSLDVPQANGNGHASAPPSGKVSPSLDDDEEEPTVPVTLTGPQPLAYEAQVMLNQIIASKISKSTQRIKDIPAHVLPFILVRKSIFQAVAEGAEVKLTANIPIREITVAGEREAAGRVTESIKSAIESFKASLTSLKIGLPKRQHRLLVGKAVDEIMAKSKCSIILPSADDPSEEIAVWGQAMDLSSGLSTVMEQANSQYIHEFPLPGPIKLSRQLLTYMNRVQYPKTLRAAHPNVSVFTPSQTVMAKAQALNVEIAGDKPEVDIVVRKVSELIGKLIGATEEVQIDWLLHRIISGKYAKKIKQFHDSHNVNVYFPFESEEQSSVLLVYDPFSPNASPSPEEKKKHLEEISKELLKFAKDVADVKSQIIIVEKRWHEAVVGEGRTTLNAVIGEDKTLSIKVGAEAADPSGEDVILVRGISSEVDRAVKEINKIIEDAKNDEIVNSFSTEFDIDREYVGRVVGAQGAGVNKLRDQLGVKVDVSDDVEEKEKEGSKKKKAVHQRSKVTITGRKENVEEAKRRILAQVERLADETSEVLKIPAQYHSSLIGQGGKYAIRLEEKYAVKITFPRQSPENGEGRTREPLKPDEVLIKGGKKGVAGAKSELLDAVEFEKESNNVVKFTVPTRSVARILGKGGASINEIKNNTDAQIDVDKASDDASVTNITIRGTKKAIAAAKTAILTISDSIAEEVTIVVPIEHKYHRHLIGPGGQALKELVSRCGANPDPKVLAGLIRFPRQGEPSDEVRLRGEPKLVNKIKEELEKTVTPLRDRVVLAVEIPAAHHSALIGRGGQHLNDLQTKTGAQIQFPGSRSYPQVGPPENADEFVGSEEANIVKVTGSRAACEKAIAELKASHKSPNLTVVNVTDTVTVPLKYHHAISQQGNFFRTLRNFNVQADHSEIPSKPAAPVRPTPASAELAARIDETEGESPAATTQWEVIENYQDCQDGDSVWTLKAKDQEGLDKAKKLLVDALAQAERMSHVGFLTLPDRTMFPRIVGAKGANVARLRNETGADITVSRENTTIVIIGSPTDIVAAKDAIIRMNSEPGRNRRNQNAQG